MSFDVAILDYGAGNLLSVRRALEKCDANVVVSEDPEIIRISPRLVLPGVGAFAEGMQGLAARGLNKVVREFAESGRPLLGICLGMQMLASVSEEFGEHAGLGIIPGRVTAISNTGHDGRLHKIPYIGWASLEKPPALVDWRGSILSSIDPGAAVYLVHSFSVVPENDNHRLANYTYDGLVISAAIRLGNVFGCQFHPEKSGEVGLKILRNFLAV